MSTPETIVGGLMALMKRGKVTLQLHAPARSRDPTERDDTPYVGVTVEGRTWAQSIRLSMNATEPSEGEIASAFGRAVEMVLRDADPPK